MIKDITDRVKLLTGEIITFKDNYSETIITCNDLEFIFTMSDKVKYSNIISYYGIDFVTEFSNVLIKKFNLTKNPLN